MTASREDTDGSAASAMPVWGAEALPLGRLRLLRDDATR